MVRIGGATNELDIPAAINVYARHVGRAEPPETPQLTGSGSISTLVPADNTNTPHVIGIGIRIMG